MGHPFREVIREPHGRDIWQAARGDLMEIVAEGIAFDIDRWLRDCESPIEVKFGIALASVAWYEIAALGGAAEHDIAVKAQAPVCDGRYRVDFLFTDPIMPCKMVVECDGHDYHERTKEQAVRDKSRDRELARRHYVTIRFTGSEIHRDPFRCANEAYDLWSDLRARAYANTDEGRFMLSGQGAVDAKDS